MYSPIVIKKQRKYNEADTTMQYYNVTIILATDITKIKKTNTTLQHCNNAALQQSSREYGTKKNNKPS